MERRHAQVFDVEEPTDLSEDDSIDVSAPTVVVSAAPLQACVTTTGATRRAIPVARPPGRPLGAPRAPRRARQWSTVPPMQETALIGPIPMPGERPSADVVTIVQRLRRPAPKAATIMLPRGAAQQAATIIAARAAEPRATYSVEREVSAHATPRRAMPRQGLGTARQVYVLVAIIALFAGFVTMLSVVVVRQQTELRRLRAPAQLASEACAAYAGEVHAIATELARGTPDVEARIGERARSVVNERGLQRLCAPHAPHPRCITTDAACVGTAVAQLRDALARGEP